MELDAIVEEKSGAAERTTAVPIMPENPNRWVGWWKAEPPTTEAHWKKNMEIFLRGTSSLIGYEKDDIVLDIGCGPGFLAAALKDRVREIHCLDISERYLSQCQERCKDAGNVFFHRLDEENYTDLSFLPRGKFTKIICLSVIQYYRNIAEVEHLISEVRRTASSGARFLIADIPSTGGPWSDLKGGLLAGFRERYLLGMLKSMIRARFSSYQDVRSACGLLALSEGDLRAMIQRLDLNAELLNTLLTLNAGRTHLLIRFA